MFIQTDNTEVRKLESQKFDSVTDGSRWQIDLPARAQLRGSL